MFMPKDAATSAMALVRVVAVRKAAVGPNDDDAEADRLFCLCRCSGRGRSPAARSWRRHDDDEERRSGRRGSRGSGREQQHDSKAGRTGACRPNGRPVALPPWIAWLMPRRSRPPVALVGVDGHRGHGARHDGVVAAPPRREGNRGRYRRAACTHEALESSPNTRPNRCGIGRSSNRCHSRMIEPTVADADGLFGMDSNRRVRWAGSDHEALEAPGARGAEPTPKRKRRRKTKGGRGRGRRRRHGQPPTDRRGGQCGPCRRGECGRAGCRGGSPGRCRAASRQLSGHRRRGWPSARLCHPSALNSDRRAHRPGHRCRARLRRRELAAGAGRRITAPGDACPADGAPHRATGPDRQAERIPVAERPARSCSPTLLACTLLARART